MPPRDYISQVGINVPAAQELPPAGVITKTAARESEQLAYALAQATGMFAREEAALHEREQQAEGIIQGEYHALEAGRALQQAWIDVSTDERLGVQDLLPAFEKREKAIREAAVKSVGQFGSYATARFIQDYSTKALNTYATAQTERFQRWRGVQQRSLDLTLKGYEQDVTEGKMSSTEAIDKANIAIGQLTPLFLSPEQGRVFRDNAVKSIYTARYNNMVSTSPGARSQFVAEVASGKMSPPIDPIERSAWGAVYKDSLSLINDQYQIDIHAQAKADYQFKQGSLERRQTALNGLLEGTYTRSNLMTDMLHMTREDYNEVDTTLTAIDKAGGHMGNTPVAANLRAQMTLDAQEGTLGQWDAPRIAAEAQRNNLNAEQVVTLSHELNSLRANERAGEEDYNHFRKLPVYAEHVAELKGMYGMPPGDLSLFNPQAVKTVTRALRRFADLAWSADVAHRQNPKLNPAITPAQLKAFQKQVITEIDPLPVIQMFQNLGGGK